MVQSLENTVLRFLKKLQTEPTYDLALPFLGVHPKDTKSLSGRDDNASMFTAELFTVVKIHKQQSAHQWMTTECDIQTHT